MVKPKGRNAGLSVRIFDQNAKTAINDEWEATPDSTAQLDHPLVDRLNGCGSPLILG